MFRIGTIRKIGAQVIVVMALMLAAGLPARGAIVTVGSHNLFANTPNQVFTIGITGTDQVAGEDFFAQLGDGGAFNGGTDTKPIFQNIDIVTGAIFAGNSVGAQGDPNGVPPGSNAGHPLLWVDGTVTSSGTSGILATVTIDTTGVNSGTFPVVLTGVASSLGSFNTTLRSASGDPIPLTVNNGSIIIVTPEPATGVLFAASAVFALARRRRG
jgi:hypothetical protein